MLLDSTEQSKRINIISTYLITLSTLAFVSFYLVLSYNIRPASDDMEMIDAIKGKNIIEYLLNYYQNTGGRWISWAYFFIVASPSDSFQQIPNFIFIYYCFTLLILTYAIYKIIRTGIHKLFDTNFEIKTILIYSFIFVACFYFCTFQNIEVWWWICASFVYLQGIVFFLLGTALMLEEKKTLWHYIFISLSFIFVGASSELYPLIVGALFITIIVYFFVKTPNKYLLLKQHWFYNGFFIAFLSLGISTIFSFSAPGNFIRRQIYVNYFPPFYRYTHVDIFTTLQEFAHIKFLAAFVLSALYLIIGIQLKSKSVGIKSKKLAKQIMLLAITAFFYSIIIPYSFQLLTYGIMPPPRAWTFTCFVLAFIFCFSFFLIGYYIHFHSLIYNAIKIFIPFTVFIFLSVNFWKQYNFSNMYSKKYDQLIVSFLEAKKNKIKEPFYMKKLPDSGMLMQFNFDGEDINGANLLHLKNILDLQYEIKVMP